MKKDIEQLCSKYPDSVHSEILGESLDGISISQSINLALCLGQFTGYDLISEISSELELGGFADWFMLDRKIPGVCVEVGLEASPVKKDEFYTVFLQNRESWAALGYRYYAEEKKK